MNPPASKEPTEVRDLYSFKRQSHVEPPEQIDPPSRSRPLPPEVEAGFLAIDREPQAEATLAEMGGIAYVFDSFFNFATGMPLSRVADLEREVEVLRDRLSALERLAAQDAASDAAFTEELLDVLSKSQPIEEMPADYDVSDAMGELD
jgi:hypothetical protein